MEITPAIVGKDGKRLEFNPRHLGFDTITIAKLRDAILADKVLSGPGVYERYMPNSVQLEHINNACRYAVTNGQVIDFGYWPNDLMKTTSMRAGKLYNQNALGMPFSSSWIFLHSWNSKTMELLGEAKPKYTAYLVSPFNDQLGTGFEALEMAAFTIAGDYTLGVGDRVVFNPQYGYDGYNVAVIPGYKRWPKDEMMLASAEGLGYDLESELSEQAAACNVIDPLMTALMILNTRGVEQEIIPAPSKLNKARIKRGKPAIPPYRKVDSTSYVTAFHARQERSTAAPGHGTHASPAPHIRIGHWRNYQTGIKSWIRDTLVNVPEELREQFRTNRSHYKVD